MSHSEEKALSGKTAIITGASRGIGEATARYFAKHGARVVLAARDAQAIDTICAEITESGGSVHAKKCDVSRYEDVKNLFDFTQDRFERVDILVNNAGRIDPIARLADSDPAEWSAIVDTNYKSVYYALHSAIPIMVENGGGTIVNISSGAATGALEGWSHYCSTKAAVLSLTRCAHKEYADLGLRIVGLSPGTVATDMQRQIKASGINPVSQLDFDSHIPPEWVARAIAYLCHETSDAHLGTDFSLKTNEGRMAVGLPALSG